MVTEGSTEASIDELFSLPLEEFTAARNALAKQVRADGDKGAAEEIKALRKPSITAWALNQVVRRQPEAVDELLATGQALRDAHERALEGDASRLRDAGRAQQQAVADLARRAAAILDEAGSSGDAHLEQLMQSLRAASTDEAAGARLQAGRLTADIEETGFGFLGAATFEPRASGVATPAATSVAKATADQDRAELRRRVASAERAAERSRKQAAEAAERAERLADEAARAEELARASRQRADEAADEARAAGARAEEAARELDAAEQAISGEG